MTDEYANHEERIAQMTEKDLLVEQLGYLHLINENLQRIDDKLASAGSESESESYQCTKCHIQIPKDDLQRHAEQEHKAPAGVDVMQLGIYE